MTDPRKTILLVAFDGEAALAMSDSFLAPVNLLITDVMMPVMNGKELADRLCTLLPELKVLFVSGFSRSDFWPLDGCEDVTDWLAKAFSGDRFRDKVRQLLAIIDGR